MALLTFDTDEIAEIGNNLDLAAMGIDQELMRLELEVLKLAGSWSGDAQAAYDQAQLKWANSMQKLQRLVLAASQLCDSAVVTYESAEKSIEQQFG